MRRIGWLFALAVIAAPVFVLASFTRTDAEKAFGGWFFYE